MVHAKLILFGEHAILYGYPAITIPLKIFKTEVTFDYQKKIAESDFVKDLKKIANLPKHVSCHINSNIPSGRGLGSSASVAYCFFKSLGLKNKHQLAIESEKIVHGGTTGLDVAQVASKDAIIFQDGRIVEKVKSSFSFYILIIDSKVFGSTKDAVRQVRDNFSDNQELIRDLGELCSQGIDSFKNNKPSKFLFLIKKAHEVLVKLKLVVPEVTNIIDICYLNGALAAKMTGSGLGGCSFAVFKSHKKATKVSKILERKGYQSWITTL